MCTAYDYSLVFNPKNSMVMTRSVTFLSCIYGAQGVHPNCGKVSAIHVMQVQEVLGMVTYLSSFIP